MGIPMGIHVGMGWVWRLKCHPHGSPGVWSGEGAVPLPKKIFVFFLYQNGDFLCIPVIFIDIILFKEGNLIKRAGVWTPYTPRGRVSCNF